jgi:beta-N-acetylhexosaminidase
MKFLFSMVFICFFSFVSNFCICDVKKMELKASFSDSEIETFINTMSLEDKVGQLFISLIYGEEMNEKAKTFIEKTHIGNFLYFRWANDLSSFSSVKKLSNAIKEEVLKTVGIIPLIATDQEGGRVSWLSSGDRKNDGFSSFPCSRDVAKKGLIYAYEMGKTIGREMKMAGLNLNFAPVVDVCPLDSYFLAPRTFGKDPETVIAYAKEMIKGLHEGGVFATLKHFPGYGSAKVNPHLSLAIVDKPLKEMMQCDLLPFIALKSETDCIMTAHVLISSLDEKNCASLSHAVLSDFLRNNLGYQGVIISDSLAMRGVTLNQKTLDEAIENLSKVTIEAFLAGCDCMIISKLEWADFKVSKDQDVEIIEKVVKNFQNAARKNEISMERINDSLRRILKLKLKILKTN